MAKKPMVTKLNMSRYESLLRQRSELDLRERTAGHYEKQDNGAQLWVWDLKELLRLAHKREKLEADVRHFFEEALKV